MDEVESEGGGEGLVDEDVVEDGGEGGGFNPFEIVKFETVGSSGRSRATSLPYSFHDRLGFRVAEESLEIVIVADGICTGLLGVDVAVEVATCAVEVRGEGRGAFDDSFEVGSVVVEGDLEIRTRRSKSSYGDPECSRAGGVEDS